jgi:hypothetical protein
MTLSGMHITKVPTGSVESIKVTTSLDTGLPQGASTGANQSHSRRCECFINTLQEIVLKGRGRAYASKVRAFEAVISPQGAVALLAFNDSREWYPTIECVTCVNCSPQL